MDLKQFSRDYLTFTRKERIGLLIILIVITGIWIFPQVIPRKSKSLNVDTSWIAVAKKLKHKEEGSEKKSGSDEERIDEFLYDKSVDQYPSIPKKELFYFDPNNLSPDGWKKLGMREKTIVTIQKYLNKGGHFYKPDDLKKIYGIHPSEYARLEPYIKIEPAVKFSQDDSKNNFTKRQLADQVSAYSPVDINTADTSAFIALPGIGNKLASRIINFRDKLGGFYSIDQVGETYGLPDSSFQRIKPFLKLENVFVKKININTASKDEMKSHPYIKWNLANVIVEYRSQHGNFTSEDDLKKITLITEEVLVKIRPYILIQ